MARKPITDMSAWPSLSLEGNLIAGDIPRPSDHLLAGQLPFDRHNRPRFAAGLAHQAMEGLRERRRSTGRSQRLPPVCALGCSI